MKNAIKTYKKEGVWVEITSLIIPGENDSSKNMEQLAKWIRKINREIPLHLSRFHPHYKMTDKNPTPEKTLEYLKEIAEKHLDYVYLGNVKTEADTKCVACKKTLVERSHYSTKINIKRGKCDCGKPLPGYYS